MDNQTNRERQAEALANSQIPGYVPEDVVASPVKTPSKNPPVAVTPDRDVIDLSGAPIEPPTDVEIEQITQDVVEQIKTVYDPEIPTDIYELGLIYKVELEDDRTLLVDMTLTAPGCPVAGEMPVWVQEACQRVEGIRRVEVSMVFDPPWTPDRMSEEARLELNML